MFGDWIVAAGILSTAGTVAIADMKSRFAQETDASSICAGFAAGNNAKGRASMPARSFSINSTADQHSVIGFDQGCCLKTGLGNG
ncbi:MAG: hypothetical protein ACRECW_10020 [Phyllobacterium sp.]